MKGDLDQAILDATEAIRLDPKFAEAYCNRGAAYGSKGEFDKAIADCTEAIQLDPGHAKAYRNRALAYRNKRELDKAVADYTEALRLEPSFARAYYETRRGVREAGREAQGRGRLRPSEKTRVRAEITGRPVRDWGDEKGDWLRKYWWFDVGAGTMSCRCLSPFSSDQGQEKGTGSAKYWWFDVGAGTMSCGACPLFRHPTSRN